MCKKYTRREVPQRTGSNPVLTTNFNRSTCSRDFANPPIDYKTAVVSYIGCGRTGG